jgi:hypothetical protein
MGGWCLESPVPSLRTKWSNPEMADNNRIASSFLLAMTMGQAFWDTPKCSPCISVPSVISVVKCYFDCFLFNRRGHKCSPCISVPSVFSAVKRYFDRLTASLPFCLTTEGTESTEIHREMKLYTILLFTMLFIIHSLSLLYFVIQFFYIPLRR